MAKKRKQTFEQALRAEMEKAQLKGFRSNMAKLKKAGLWKGDARSVKQTKHYKALIVKYNDVLTGKVKAVKVPEYCPLGACKTVKRGKKTIALINVENIRKPKIKPTKAGLSVIDEFFGGGEMEILISANASDILGLSDDEIDGIQAHLDANTDTSFVFTIDRPDGAYMSKLRFINAGDMINYLGKYKNDGGNFTDVKVSLRLMSNADIGAYTAKQTENTRVKKKARDAENKRKSRAKNKSWLRGLV